MRSTAFENLILGLLTKCVKHPFSFLIRPECSNPNVYLFVNTTMKLTGIKLHKTLFLSSFADRDVAPFEIDPEATTFVAAEQIVLNMLISFVWFVACRKTWKTPSDEGLVYIWTGSNGYWIKYIIVLCLSCTVAAIFLLR